MRRMHGQIKTKPSEHASFNSSQFIRFYANRDTQTYARVYVYVVCYVAFMNALLSSGPK